MIPTKKTLIFILVGTSIITALLIPHMQVLFANISLGDEGIVTQSAYRIYQGQVPYKDFFGGMTPAVYYWVAFFMYLLGPTFLAGRIAALVVTFTILLLSCLILYRFQIRNRTPYLVLLSFQAYFVGLYWFIPSHHWLALALCLGSFLFILPSEAPMKTRPRSFAAGVLGAGVALTMQHMGILWLAGVLVGHSWAPKTTRKTSLKYFLIGFFGAAIPVAAYFLAVVGFEQLFQDLVVLPLTRYHNVADHHNLQFKYMVDHWQTIIATWPTQLRALYVLRTLTLILSFVGLIIVHLLPILGTAGLIVLYKKKLYPASFIAFLATFFATNYLTAMNRIADTSLVFASPAAIIILALWIAKSSQSKPAHWLTHKKVAVAWTIFFFALFSSEIAFNSLFPTRATQSPAGTIYSRDVKEFRTFQALTQLFGPERLKTEQIFFYSYSPMFYFLLHAKNPTPYDSLVYPMATLEQIEEVKSMLEQKQCKWVVLTTSKLENDPLLKYLEEKYRVTGMYSYALILERK